MLRMKYRTRHFLSLPKCKSNRFSSLFTQLGEPHQEGCSRRCSLTCETQVRSNMDSRRKLRHPGCGLNNPELKLHSRKAKRTLPDSREFQQSLVSNCQV